MSDDVPLGPLFGILVVLLALSAFFSSSETALMSLNRYRLRHKARAGHHAARIAERLLQRPDRLIGLILLGNNLVNLAAAALVTVISLRLGGERAIFVGTLILTFVILIFAEVAPKTIAALHPQRLAFPAALVYYPLLKVTYPIVWSINLIANGLLRLVGVHPDRGTSHSLTSDELRTVLAEAGVIIPRRHQRMLISILDLDAITVDDVMVPRQEIAGIDLELDWERNLALMHNCEYSRLPVYRDDIDNLIGVIRVRRLLPELARGTLDETSLLAHIREPSFVPEGTPLNRQLLNFQQNERRSAFVIDEYGDIQGMITTEDILREIVGEFDAGSSPQDLGITRESDNRYVVDAGTNIRQLNRLMSWHLPTNGPKTLNGLIIEQLETIPDPGTCLDIAGFRIEILERTEHAIRKARIVVPESKPKRAGFS